VPTNYPNDTDRFFEPSLPEQIPLSQTGSQPGSQNVDGRRARNHVEHHRDLGDAVQALQENAARSTHDHSGVGTDTAKGNKLSWANTHQASAAQTTLAAARALADTDGSATAIHHTLGTAANQAAAGDHTHDYDAPNRGGIVNAPLLRCLSTARPQNPTEGLVIYEVDTNRMRAWGDFRQGNGLRWNLLTAASVPVLRLVQSEAQSLNVPQGVLVKWQKADEYDDTFAFFNPSSSDASKQTIRVTEPGVYQVDCAVQWGSGFIPEMATVVVCRNGAETTLRFSRIQGPNFILNLLGLPNAERSQTIAVSGKLRLSHNDELTVRCRYGGLVPGGYFVNTFLDLDSKVRSRLDMQYVGP
jgi:hypothetical protein